MRDYLTLGPTPCGEDCQQVGPTFDCEKSNKELKAFKHQLERYFKNIPDGSKFGIKTFPHDFGPYSEVVVYFDCENDESSDFAFHVESNIPEFWDEKSKEEMGIL